MLVAEASYMQRCFDLARLAAGRTSPNPMVGAVLAHQGRIIGEGYHSRYGQAHAEVEAVRSVTQADHIKIKDATLYVSLEPCSIHGRTPPCTDLILREQIRKVVIACRDESPGVNGEGVAILRKHGVEVVEGVLSAAGQWLSQPRNTFVSKQRPYVILKYAVSADGFLGAANGRPFWLSNAFSKRLVHRWRSETDAIMVGARTALIDNPQLNTRLFPGPSPIRIIPDRHLRLPLHLHIFDDSIPTLIFTQEPVPVHAFKQTIYTRLEGQHFLPALLEHLHQRNIQTLMLEGGKVMLDEFIASGLWDEARVFLTPHYLTCGLAAPVLGLPPVKEMKLGSDRLLVFRNLG